MAIPLKEIIEIIIWILQLIFDGMNKGDAIDKVASAKGLSSNVVSDLFDKYSK